MSLTRIADADEPTPTSAKAALALAEQADAALAFGQALTSYETVYSLDPHSTSGRTAHARAAYLRAHAEAGFAPLAELERVRRAPALANDEHETERLVAHAESFPPGLVRIEIWVFAAEAYAQRLGNPDAADLLLGRVLADPLAEPAIARKAARDLFALRAERKDIAGARNVLRLAGAHADSALAADVRKLVRRRKMHVASTAILLATFLLAARSIAIAALAGRRANLRAAFLRTWKPALGFAAYVSLVGALLAFVHERGTEAPLLALGLVVFPVVLLARVWGASGSRRAIPRFLRATACAAATLAGAFLVAEAVSTPLLEGIGL